MRPKENEDYSLFLGRCRSEGYSHRDCNLIYNEQLPLVRFLRRFERRLEAKIGDYTTRVEEALRMDENELFAVLFAMHLDVGKFTTQQYAKRFKGEPVSDVIIEQYTTNRLNDIDITIGDDVSRQRASKIADTEARVSKSHAEWETMRRLGYKKYWIGILDDRIRDSHLNAAFDYPPTAAIAMDDFFSVNGSLMKHPHDSNAPAEELINCRCMLGYTKRF